VRTVYAIRLQNGMYLGEDGFPANLNDAQLTTTYPDGPPGSVAVDVSMHLRDELLERGTWCLRIAKLLDITPKETA
jgi:hypothetical protein